MNIIISGSTGFIGKHLIKKLRENGHSVCAIVRPSTNTDFLKSENIPYYTFGDNIEELALFMKQEEFDGVIHLASLFLSEHTTKDVRALIDSNVYFGSAILEASAKSNVKWFLNTGTFWQHYKDKEYSPVNLYAATKQAFEDIAKYYVETSSINFATLKLSDTFGPNDTRSKIFTLWNKISKSGEQMEMSKGAQIIDINYIDNVIDGFSRMITLLSEDKKRKLNGKSFALKSKNRMTLKELAELFEKTTGKKLNIAWGKKPYRLREVMRPWTRGKSIPGWKQKISTEEGIKKTFKE